jgi:hypothetical protein
VDEKAFFLRGSILIKIIKMDRLTLEEKIVDVSTLYKLENLLRIFQLLIKDLINNFELENNSQGKSSGF